MANATGSGSPLANIAARHSAVQRARANLGIGTVAPNASSPRPAAPPRQPKSAPSNEPEVALPAVPDGVDPNSRDGMLAMAKGVLDQARSSGGQPPAPLPPAIQSPQSTGPAGSLPDRLAQLGATALPAATQFQRLAGRPPTGRELTVYASYAQLTNELGRPPTRTELAYRVTQARTSASIEPVV